MTVAVNGVARYVGDVRSLLLCALLASGCSNPLAPSQDGLSLDVSRWGLQFAAINDASGALVIAPYPGSILGYITTPYRGPVTTLRLSGRVAGTWQAVEPCSVPGATLTAFVHADGDDWASPDSRWWSYADQVRLEPGDFARDIPLTPERWSNVDGQRGDTRPEAFQQALRRVSSVGFTLGSACAFGHGVIVAGSLPLSAFRVL